MVWGTLGAMGASSLSSLAPHHHETALNGEKPPPGAWEGSSDSQQLLLAAARRERWWQKSRGSGLRSMHEPFWRIKDKGLPAKQFWRIWARRKSRGGPTQQEPPRSANLPTRSRIATFFFLLLPASCFQRGAPASRKSKVSQLLHLGQARLNAV
jgi:hypothetical protein